MSETAFYLFCFARSGPLPELGGTGVDGQSPLLVRTFADLAAVLSTVYVADFSGPVAEARMKDLSWLGPRACRHEAVIEEVMAYGPVLPARFGTLFSSLESLEALLVKHHRAISQFLDDVTGREEWGVKGVLNRAKALPELDSRYQTGGAGQGEPNIDPSSLPRGTRYLQGRRARAAAEKALPQWLQATCAGIAEDLRGYASGFIVRKALAKGASGSEVVSDWAFLVPRGVRVDFCGRVKRASAELADQGLTFELTGPWPPYHFMPSLTS